MMTKYRTIFVHIALIFIFILLDSLKYLIGIQKVNFLILSLYYVYDIGFFYFTSYVYLPFTYRKIADKTWRLIISFAAVIIYWLMIMPYSILVKLSNNLPPSVSFSPETINLILYRASLILGFAYVLWHNKYLLRMEKEQSMERERNLQLENDLLRAQLNPHMVNNAIGLVHEHLIDKSPEDAQILEMLTEITSVAFIQSKSKGAVSLKSEIDTVYAYLKLHDKIKEGVSYLKFNNNLDHLDNLKIYPYILLEPVLNLLKYADLSKKNEPATIAITLENGLLIFKTWNRKITQQSLPTHHFGLENLKSRLSAYYPSKYDLKVDDTQSTFSLTLKISL